MKSKWPEALDLAGSNLPCRLEGEIADLVVLGEIPKEIDGTFYRVMTDPFAPPHPGNVPLDGDGNISAFRFENGRVDMKMRYVETERYMLERKANKALFGLYRNPFSHHPCVRAAVDSTANTNLVLWADRFMALKEGGLPYQVDPHSLGTLGYDPFGLKDLSKTFTAHPKVDPYTGELVVFGYEAKGLASPDIFVFTLDADGVRHDEQWVQSPWVAPIHDCAITPNWLILCLWPFEANVERMKRGGHHWAWDYARPATFIVVPRRASTPLPSGWQPGEHRVYEWRNSMLIHTAGAWEEADGTTLRLETSRVLDNAFPFFPPDDGRMPSPDAQADFVCWTLDLTQPSGPLPDPEVIFDQPSEFPRVDERFLTQPYDVLFLNVVLPDPNVTHGAMALFQELNGLAMLRRSTGEVRYFRAGEGSLVQEPIFVPRSSDAPEGDGWVMAMVERRAGNRNDLVVIDTRDFETAVAIVQLPFHVKAQVHGNWIDQKQLKDRRRLVKSVDEVKISGLGALEPL
ncbi:lignostilbene dioxygenase [Plectosphaerella plurivora]|uniref:Lignostilbene dioxygenase n=1 Tax=Plectosphaerella plurivora TaxID=936078 RepID=A0A9P8UYT7_9PEZI|nr:lignostilbene dioxygenase [Plectosphaerella plurivora]